MAVNGDLPAGPPASPILVFTQGDPAGIGPEILCKVLLAERGPGGVDGAGADFAPLLIVERAAVEAIRPALPDLDWSRLRFSPERSPGSVAVRAAARAGRVLAIDPTDKPPGPPGPEGPSGPADRRVEPGVSSPSDARGAMAALDLGIDWVRSGRAQALVTAPVAKSSIARAGWPEFRGHTEYLAAAAGLERYGRDYLMAFLAPDLQVALLSVHEPLRQALASLSAAAIVEALRCLDRGGGGGGRIAVAGLNPHAGESGLLGAEDEQIVRPAVEAARAEGIDARGPESADSLFARARQGEFDWVLALYHDQGLIAVKTAAFGLATNWTLGLPFLRTSVDHGTAFAIAGRGIADERPLRAVIETTLGLLRGDLPRRHVREADPATDGESRGGS